MDDAQFRTWKTQLVPLLYDWFSNHNLTWPTQACRWGRKLDEHTYKNRYRLYLSEQTDFSSKEPPKLLVVEADICKPRVASSEAVTGWHELSKCPYVKEWKTLVHPGEVNKIRELPQHPDIIITHTDDPKLYVWNLARQQDQKKGADKRWPAPALADLVLVGHREMAQFPLATCASAPLVASGGTDRLVLAWDLQDSMEGLLAKGNPSEKGPELDARWRFEGHKETVEDVIIAPGSTQLLASVGDDAQMLFWDARVGSAPVAAVSAAHGSGTDIHTLDWSGLEEHLVASGAADGSLRVWDRRRLGQPGSSSSSSSGGPSCEPLKSFNFHQEAIMRVEWHPTAKGVLASGGEDQLVVVWSLDRARAQASTAAPGGEGARSAKAVPPPEVIFKHVGHRQGKVVDMQWCPSEPWTMMSVSDNTDVEGEGGGSGRGGGTLQMWRISDLIYRPEEEVVAELETHREWIINGKNPPKQLRKPPGRAPSADVGPSAADAAANGREAGGAAEGQSPAATTAAEATASKDQEPETQQQQQQPQQQADDSDAGGQPSQQPEEQQQQQQQVEDPMEVDAAT